MKTFPLAILGEEIDPEYMPILYKWAQTNPDTLKETLQNLADKWHGGSIGSAMQALESDMEHG